MELIKTEEGYYVPKEYLYDKDTGEKIEIGFVEYVAAAPPSYDYDKETKKWCLEFFGPGDCGYNIENFTFFFDSEEDLLRFLKR